MPCHTTVRHHLRRNKRIISPIRQHIRRVDKSGRYMPRPFTRQEGLKRAVEQINFYAPSIPAGEKREQFYDETMEKVNESMKTAKSGYDVFRGTDIEALAWKYRGKTQAEYGAYLRSLD